MLRAEDFNDDTKDAGEIGAGHTVTAFYEIVPAGVNMDLPEVDPLKYQDSRSDASFDDGESRGLKPAAQDGDRVPAGRDGEYVAAAQSGELMTVKLRYKEPDGDTSKLIEFVARDGGSVFDDMSDDFVFGASVASFGMLLRGSQYSGDFTFDAVRETASTALGEDPFGYRTEFVSLVEKANALQVEQR
jgi:Ca-activated chloride channel family protein